MISVKSFGASSRLISIESTFTLEQQKKNAFCQNLVSKVGIGFLRLPYTDPDSNSNSLTSISTSSDFANQMCNSDYPE